MAACGTIYSSGNVLGSGVQMGSAGDTASAEPATVKVGITLPRFLAFLVAQFLGAVNDNAFKITLILFLLSIISGEARQVRYSSRATVLFPIPFLLFSPIDSRSIAFCYGPSFPRSSRWRSRPSDFIHVAFRSCSSSCFSPRPTAPFTRPRNTESCRRFSLTLTSPPPTASSS
jgi:hypothetical protein